MLDNEGRPVNHDMMMGYLYNQQMLSASSEETKSDNSSENTGDKSPSSSPGTIAF